MPVRKRLGLLFKCLYVPSCGLTEAPGGNLKVWEEKGPFPGSSVEGLEWLGGARHGFCLEHTIKVLVMARINELLCASWGCSDVVMSYSQRLEWTEKGQLEIR